MFRRLSLALASVSLTLAACGALGLESDSPASAGLPTVSILSPASGSEVPLNSVVTVEASALDSAGPGVFRLDLLVDGVIVDTFEAAGPQTALSAALHFTPTAEGAKSVSVIPYRQDGTPGVAASVALSVAGEAAQAAAAPAEQPADSAQAGVQGVAESQLYVRSGPGPGCDIVGVLPDNQMATLVAAANYPAQPWFQTDYLGRSNLGWVYYQSLNVQGDTASLPRVPLSGCALSGSSSAASASSGQSAQQAANSASTGGNDQQPPVPENDPTGADGSLCGDGVCQSGEAADWCGDCTPPEEEAPPPEPPAEDDPCVIYSSGTYEYCTECLGGSWISGFAGYFCGPPGSGWGQ